MKANLEHGNVIRAGVRAVGWKAGRVHGGEPFKAVREEHKPPIDGCTNRQRRI